MRGVFNKSNGYKEINTIFTILLNMQITMNKDDQKRKEVLARLQAAREKKQASLVQLEKYMRKIYKERTGKDAGEFFAL